MGKLQSLFNRGRKSQPESAPEPRPESESESESITDLERVFNKFDTNGDGKISSSELAAIFSSLDCPVTADELSIMMSSADSDGDGFISLDEFAGLNTVDVDDANEDLRQAFSVFDSDRNGSISAEELARVLRSLGEEGVDVDKCRRMIEGVDKDGDGSVSFEEFKLMMSGSGIGSFKI